MASRVWSHLCDYASVDANGKAMIIGEFDNIFSANVPLKHPLFFVITKWAGSENEQFTHRVRITGTNRETIAESPKLTTIIQRTINGEGYHTSVDAFMLTEFKHFGECSVELILNDIPIHILPLRITQLTQP